VAPLHGRLGARLRQRRPRPPPGPRRRAGARWHHGHAAHP
jgi:hypothetical protein